MELKLQSFSLPSPVSSIRDVKMLNSVSSFDSKSSSKKSKRSSIAVPALAETAASIAIAGTVVGVAATLLVQRTKAPEVTEVRMRDCDDCGGSGICSECKGEGFVLKKLSDESAEKARLTAKNMATRYTAGLPKKWSYCTKCSSARSCTACGGRGKISY
ncbi:PREDICTED: uncharacterized protein LOC104814822 [Tarenaya hassleriana]|uniref:uncharacterized protein LOC104814822 n=1 Tax=Tarenaya hassleriana TaxID=28532 RepID=UPI00053C9561|nr:PREDICTED: uncharacterized protein LOC104814822 [Tarenaya hassleriana]